MPRTPAGEVVTVMTRDKQASEAQVRFIQTLVRDRDWEHNEELADLIGLDKLNLDDIRTHEASRIISALKSCPFKPRQQAVRVTVEDVGFYLLGDKATRIMLSRGGFPYGAQYTGNGTWEYVEGYAKVIKRNGVKLEGDVLAALAVKLQFCRKCGLELTNPESQAVGIGPQCAAKLGL